ncbi:MAG: cupin domain-containing protein [Candidatus Omnitrophica bacterium]|nr:cupin domain-containing protein [Candidatus Omnitrophota bacterium]
MMIKRKNQQEMEVRKNMRGGPGEVTLRHYFKPEEITARTRLCAELRLPPGAGIGIHDHTGEDEIYIIQRGQGKVTDGGKEVEVEAGDAILTGKGASHSIQNSGHEDLIVTAVIMKY